MFSNQIVCQLPSTMPVQRRSVPLYSFCFSILFILVLCTSACSGMAEKQEYCSFFKNRAPKPQPNIRNCTWFNKNSCCVQEEIQRTFARVKSLPGAQPSCQKYTNYLMCYICAPNQYSFYSQGYLTVCEEFCNAWYEACGTAILKGAMINELYNSGRDFCLSRSFKVDTVVNQMCFHFAKSMDPTSKASYTKTHTYFLAAFGVAFLYNVIFMWVT